MLHELKIEPKYFEAVSKGNKNFEVRRNDRPFHVGDFIALNEFENKHYTGRFIIAKITYILNDSEYTKKGYVILGIIPSSISIDDAYEWNRQPYKVYGDDTT